MFKQRKHKTFNYKPRLSQENTTDSNQEDNSKTKDFVSKWRRQNPNKVKMASVMPVRTLILVLILLLLCMYLLEKNYL